MRLINGIRNPGYCYRPSFPIARFAQPRNGYRVVIPAWQLSLSVDPAEEIGRAMVRMDVYDLPVSETIWQLLDAGDYAIDVGASLGDIMHRIVSEVLRRWPVRDVGLVGVTSRNGIQSTFRLAIALTRVLHLRILGTKASEKELKARCRTMVQTQVRKRGRILDFAAVGIQLFQ